MVDVYRFETPYVLAVKIEDDLWWVELHGEGTLLMSDLEFHTKFFRIRPLHNGVL